jgi:ATP-binding cassette subfamily C (CFTR/MRP) protein 4
MSKGQVKEFDSPYNLLQNENSLLTKMVEKTGPSASKKLHQMAMDTHLSRTKLVRSYL